MSRVCPRKKGRTTWPRKGAGEQKKPKRKTPSHHPTFPWCLQATACFPSGIGLSEVLVLVGPESGRIRRRIPAEEWIRVRFTIETLYSLVPSIALHPEQVSPSRTPFTHRPHHPWRAVVWVLVVRQMDLYRLKDDGKIHNIKGVSKYKIQTPADKFLQPSDTIWIRHSTIRTGKIGPKWAIKAAE